MRSLISRDRIESSASVRESAVLRNAQVDGPAEMPTWDEPAHHSGRASFDEVLVLDTRASLRPAEMVERKLISLLKSVYLPVSHVRTMPLCGGRSHPSASSAPLDRRVDRTASVQSTAVSAGWEPSLQQAQFATTFTAIEETMLSANNCVNALFKVG